MNIILIDTWSKGLKFFQPVIDEMLKLHDIKFTLLHANSLYAPNIETVTNSNIREIDLYEYGYSFHKLCLENRFDAAIFVSSHDVFHRWANSVLKLYNVPCYHYMHGMRFSGVVRKRPRQIIILIERLYLYLRQGFYIMKDQSLSNIMRLPQVLYIIIASMLYRSAKKRPPVKYWGLNYQLIFLNFKGDRSYFKNFLGNDIDDKQRYLVSGNVLSDLNTNLNTKLGNSESHKVLFISQPFYDTRQSGLERYVKDIRRIDYIVKDMGLVLMVRPHPADTDEFKDLLKKNSIKTDAYNGLNDAVNSAKLTIGVNSAALVGIIRARKKLLVLSLDYAERLPDYMVDMNFCVRSELSSLKQNLQRLLQLPEAFPDSDVSKKKSAAFVAYEVLSDLKVFKDGD